MTACSRPDCSGTIDEDGYCDTCGLEAPVTAPAPATVGASAAPATGAPAPAELDGPTVSTRSTRTGSTATNWTSPTAASGAVTTRSRRGSTRSSSRGLLGAGLVEIPRVPYRDPRSAVLADPKVPESKRFCSSCGTKVGRGSEGTPGRTEGFCTKCGHRFSFSPKLSPGEVLHDQYEVLGCLAHGGLGWIYLALDRAVADRWVVLKGLLDTGDADAMAAAVAERRFLAEVEHPNIVKIHNFVQHRDAESGAMVGYIVMEYVGGQSLKDMIKNLRKGQGAEAVLPLPQAIAYVLEMLPPIGYLHSLNLLFCDFKPDNVIQTEEQLKLIDLGAVRHVDDEDSPVYGTIGYQAPEIASVGPSRSSDLYTIGRTLAVMTFPFDFQHGNRETLPNPVDEPLLATFESYDRFLRRAAAAEPTARFGSAEEMREQLTGVLREVLATEDGLPRPGASTEFTPERRAFGVRNGVRSGPDLGELVTSLPAPRIDGADPAAAFLASVTSTDPAALIEELHTAPQSSIEVRLRIARAYIELGDLVSALRRLDDVARDAVDHDRLWLVDWHRGLAHLAENNPAAARDRFDRVYSAVPGEAAPKLAIAACAEAMQDWLAADRYYRVVWRTDRAYVSAAFGLARSLLARGERHEAFEVLCSVPETSNHYVAARLAAVGARTTVGSITQLTDEDLTAAGTLLTDLEVDAQRRVRATTDVLTAAFDRLRAGHNPTGGTTASTTVLGYALTEHGLRTGLERCYRTLARHADNTKERIALVDTANRIRPRTWV
ncbi:serine/threonine protein kinase [Actinophytocola xinjiangensis]|uniref:non-specific serine/threonine protein kinase n=1 Tax=Actinophytocola xinjiangensis TaxID=485602 RepID=A0A7Z1AZS4_9PSEU|nr:serine/threonine-protein kinase [Actinophytocola xinjiangensis]OLF13824.1 serine/threonine protein kinase [Actinophytocola xinjiangensis]